MPMNRFILILGLAIVATLFGCEIYLLISHWRTITNTANSGTIGPLITSIFTPAVAVVTVLFSYLLITVQFERNRELEKVKQRLGEVYKRESEAYFAVWKAIAQAYRLLSELERGTFDAGSPEKIAKAFGEAEIYIFILSAGHQGRFYSYWQKANELLARIPRAATAADKKALWTAQMPLLFADYKPIRDQFKDVYLAQ
jgi:hypothetical protein